MTTRARAFYLLKSRINPILSDFLNPILSDFLKSDPQLYNRPKALSVLTLSSVFIQSTSFKILVKLQLVVDSFDGWTSIALTFLDSIDSSNETALDFK